MEANKKTIRIVVACSHAAAGCLRAQGRAAVIQLTRSGVRGTGGRRGEGRHRRRSTQLLGPGVEELLDSGDPVQDKLDRADLRRPRTGTSTRWNRPTKTRALLVVGDNDSVFPIPAVKRDGKWVLDGNAGADELVYRRVGANELGAIGVMRATSMRRTNTLPTAMMAIRAGIFALKLVSDPGLQNGLYWETAEGEEPSPAGEFVAAAAAEGYRGSSRWPDLSRLPLSHAVSPGRPTPMAARATIS